MEDIIVKNTDKKNAPGPGSDIFLARNSVARAMFDEDAPRVSIFVGAYNRLDKTKVCIECILKYTDDIDYELILVDNGSTDGTFDYFRTIEYPKKKLIKITKNIGAHYSAIVAREHARGGYFVGIPNDVYVTKNWLSNMLKCAMSDHRIGMVNPLTSNSSNLQNANITFENFDEMQRKAAEHNVSDPKKWHERIRLVTLGTLYKRECLDMIGKTDYGFFHDFVDDDMTFRVRRAGYKAVLCKDVFVHHDHAMLEGRDSQEFAESIEKGRANFREKYFGVDAWDDVNNYEITMMSMINPGEKRECIAPQILGMDVLCGTPILELKNRLRMAGIYDAQLSAFSSEAKYYIDLQTICNGKVYVDRPEYLSEHFDGDEFDYVIAGRPINTYREPYRLLKDMFSLLKRDGHLFVKLSNTYDIRAYFAAMGNKIAGDSSATYHISLEDLNAYSAKYRYCFKKITAEFHSLEESLRAVLKKEIQSSGIAGNVEETFTKMMVRDYVIDIVRK